MILSLQFKQQNLHQSQIQKMNLEQRIEQQEEAQHYLEQKNIYEILQSVVQDLLVAQPDDPISFMITHLGQADRKIIFLIGPPGLKLYKRAETALNSNSKNQFVAFNCGQFVASNRSLFSQSAQKLLSESRLIPDGAIQQKILQQTVNFCKKNSHSIIQGFPKTLGQAITFQKKARAPDRIIFVNVDQKKLRQLCLKKVKTHSENLSDDKQNQLAQKAAKQYEMNIKDLKKYYPNYLEINATQESDEEISRGISRCLGLSFGQLQPRKNTRIVVVGAPFSGRTTLGKKIASKYNLIYVSTAVLISEQIRRGTVTGRKIKQKYAANQIIDNFTVQKLLEQRISKRDCEMQGYVIQGYPKNKQQLQNLKNLHIHPNFIIGVNPSQQTILARSGQQKNTQQFKKRFNKWKQFEKALKLQNGVFWVNPNFNTENAFEEVCFQIENRKLA